MKIGIYNPYLNMFGGGERYVLSIAEYLSQKHLVDILTDDRLYKNKAEKFFHLNLKRVNFINNFVSKTNVLKRYQMLGQYDIFVYVTDGSLFFSGAKKNLLIIHSPSHFPRVVNLIDRLKINNWQALCYSQFIQKLIRERLWVEALILSPGIDTQYFRPNPKKERIILSVGRFFMYPHQKKQDFLIRCFKKIIDEGQTDWQLILAGGVSEEGGQKYLDRLKEEIRGYPIHLHINIQANHLKELYGQASIYWHAAGFDEDLERFPEKAEHFGMTTVEAMSGGAVPIVYAAGGQKEIVESGRNGFLFYTEGELTKYTRELMSETKKLARLSVNARQRAQDFSLTNFYAKVDQIFKL